MKREHVDDKQDPSTILMFHHHQPRKLQHLSQPLLHRPSTAECSEETDSRSPTRRNAEDDSFPPPPPPQDGATIEVVRRPRGRPPGSKNKPKPPVIITRDSSEPAMSPYVLELPPGVDIIESIASFCRRRSIGLCVLNGNGVVTNVTLKQPSSTPGGTVTFHGRFDVLSLSATILPAGGYPAGDGLFTISLAGPQGQVVGGVVVGPLVSAGTMYLIAATFDSPSFHRLQHVDSEDPAAVGIGDERRGESPQTLSGGDIPTAEESAGAVSIFSYQPSDVIWAPTARQPQPPPPPRPY